jgi:exosome complex component RRP45
MIELQHTPSSRAPVPLAIHHTPFCLTFAFFTPSSQSKPTCLLDPAHLEQRLCAGTLSLALNAQRELCVVHKAGGLPLAPEEVLKAVDVAVLKAKELDKFVDEQLRLDWAGRHVEVR